MASVRHARTRAHACTLAALLAVLPLGSCADGPFAHASPFDRGSALQLTIVGGLDTVKVANVSVLYQLVTVPVVNGYTAQWSSSAPGTFAPLGDGRFVVQGSPPANFPVQIRARFLPGNEAVRNVVITLTP
jgi:hypothetical protein